jgi:hypothetical protein
MDDEMFIDEVLGEEHDYVENNENDYNQNSNS